MAAKAKTRRPARENGRGEQATRVEAVSREAAERKAVTLDYEAPPGRAVFVAGTFNGWAPEQEALKPVDDRGRYETVLTLPPGRYEYKFVVDGQWRIDGGNPRWVPNGFGSLNSVMEVR